MCESPLSAPSGKSVSISKHNRSIKQKIQDGNRKRKRKQCCPVRRLLYTLSEKTRKGASKLKAKSSRTWLKKLKPDVMRKEIGIMLLLAVAILVIGYCGSANDGMSNKDVMQGRLEQAQLSHDIQNADSTWPPFPVLQFIGQLFLGFGDKTSDDVTQEEEIYNAESTENHDLDAPLEADEPEVKEGDTNPDVAIASDEDTTCTCALYLDLPTGNEDNPVGAVDTLTSNSDTRARDDSMEPVVDLVTEPEYAENNCVTKLCDRTTGEESEVGLGFADDSSYMYNPLVMGALNVSPSDMEDREDGSRCFKAVQVSDSTSSVAENEGQQGVEACEDVLNNLWTHLKKADGSNQYECERLLRCVLGPDRLVIKEHISNGFKVHSSVNEVMYMATRNTQTGEEKCHAVQVHHGERSDICLIEDKPLHDYMNLVDKGSFTTLPVFNSSFFVLETARTHQFCYSELGSNQELVYSFKKLDSSANGTVPIVSESSLDSNFYHQNLSVELVSASIVSVPSGAKNTPKGSSQTCPKKTQTQCQYTARSVGCCGMFSGSSDGGDGDGEDDDGRDRRRKNLPADRLSFKQSTKRKKKKQLLELDKDQQLVELRHDSQQILLSFCCNFCRCSPQDEDRLCILLRSTIKDDLTVVCSQTDCPGKNLTSANIRTVYVHVRESLLRLFHVLRDNGQDTKALKAAVEAVRECFCCHICYANYIYADNPIFVCKNSHCICEKCTENCREKFSGQCPFCRSSLGDGLLMQWPQLMFEALNQQAQEDPRPSSPGKLMDLACGPPDDMMYHPSDGIQGGMYSFHEDNRPESDIYDSAISSRRRGYLETLYGAHVDTTLTEHQVEEQHSPVQDAPRLPPSLIGVNMAAAAPPSRDDEKSTYHDELFQQRLQNYQRTYVPHGDFQQLVEENLSNLDRCNQFLYGAQYQSQYQSHEDVRLEDTEQEQATVNVQPQTLVELQAKAGEDIQLSVEADTAQQGNLEYGNDDSSSDEGDQAEQTNVTGAGLGAALDNELLQDTRISSNQNAVADEVDSAMMDTASEGLPSSRKHNRLIS